jgi:hypothetical protein
MAYISRPLPRDLPETQVVEALDQALAVNPDPAYLVETLPDALLAVTGRRFEVLDRSVGDVTGTHLRRAVMIRDGDVGHWPGYDAMRYSLLASPDDAAAARAALSEPASRMSGWGPPGPIGPEAEAGPEASDQTDAGDETGHQPEPRVSEEALPGPPAQAAE